MGTIRFAFWCRDCHKAAFRTRKEARAARRVYPHTKGLDAYNCPTHPGVWHLGHMARPIRRGHEHPYWDRRATPREPIRLVDFPDQDTG